MSASQSQTLRRSSRVPIHVPVHVTSLEPNAQFSEVCETLVVSAHGCALRFPIQLNAGSALHLHSKEGRQATAHVVACHPMESDGRSWTLGAKLDQPDNFWGLKSHPDDWRIVEMAAPTAQPLSQKLSRAQAPAQARNSFQPAQAILDKVEEQLSEHRLQGILAKLLRPLQGELSELKEKLARNARQNRFEVSLGQIPPELEQKLWERLRQDLGARVLEQTREQSAQILSSAKMATEQKISAALAELRRQLAGELHAVEQRAQALSKELTTTAHQHVHAGIEKLEQQTIDAGAQLSVHGEKLVGSLERRLVDIHDAHRLEIEKNHADTAARTLELRSHVADLGRRIEPLNESVRRLESDLDAHLESVAGEIVSQARTQLEAALALALKDFKVRSSNEVETRVDEVCGHLRTIQNRIENSFDGSITVQIEEATQSVRRQLEELMQQSMERWRLALARDLNSVAKTLGQQLQQGFESETGQS